MSMLRNHLATTSHYVFGASLLVLIVSPCVLGQLTCIETPQVYTDGTAWTSWFSECVWSGSGLPTGTTSSTATAATSNSSSDDDGGGGSGIGVVAIAGIAAGVLLILAFLLGIFFWRRRRAAQQRQQQHANKESLLGPTVATPACPTARRSTQAARDMTNVARSPQEHHDLIRDASPVNTSDGPTSLSSDNDYSSAYSQTQSQALRAQTHAQHAVASSQTQRTLTSLSYSHDPSLEGSGMTTAAVATPTSASPRQVSSDDTQANIIARQKELERNYQRKEIGHLIGFSAAGSSSTRPIAISMSSDSPPPYQE